MPSVVVSIRFSPEQIESMDSKASELGLSRTDLIHEALEAYGAISLGEDFAAKLQLHLGVSTHEDLCRLIESLTRGVSSSSVSESPSGSPQLPPAPPSSLPSPSTAPFDKAVKDVLEYVISELEAGRDVIFSSLVQKFDVPASNLSNRIGIKMVRKQFKGQRERYYQVSDLEAIKAVYNSI